MTRFLLSLVAAAFFLSACNTVAGIGEDISVGGQKMKDAAKKNKK